MRWRDSLRARLMLGAALMLLVFLAGAGWAVQRAHEESVRAARFARLQTTVYLLLAAAEVDADGRARHAGGVPRAAPVAARLGPLREHRQRRAQGRPGARRRRSASRRRCCATSAPGNGATRSRAPAAATTSRSAPACRGPAARARCRWCSRCPRTRPSSTARSPSSSARRGRGWAAPRCCCSSRRRCCCAGAWRRSARRRARSAPSSTASRRRSRGAIRSRSPRSPTTSTP